MSNVRHGGGIPKLDEIAERICQHLKRMESTRYKGGGIFYLPTAQRAGRFLNIKYCSFKYSYNIAKEDAWAYLQWLDAGNEGTHNVAFRIMGNVQ